VRSSALLHCFSKSPPNTALAYERFLTSPDVDAISATTFKVDP